MYSSPIWLRGMTLRTSFMFTQGWLTAADFQHPLLAFPIVTIICASGMHYYSMTPAGASSGAIALAGDGVVYALYLIQWITGASTNNASVFVLILYMVILRGISSSCGLAFLFWKGFLFIINSGLQLLAYAPVAMIKSGLAPLGQETHQPVLGLLTPDTTPTSKLDATDSNKTSWVDSGAEQSGLSSSADSPTPDPEVALDVKPGNKLVSQSHLLPMDISDGGAGSPKFFSWQTCETDAYWMDFDQCLGEHAVIATTRKILRCGTFLITLQPRKRLNDRIYFSRKFGFPDPPLLVSGHSTDFGQRRYSYYPYSYYRRWSPLVGMLVLPRVFRGMVGGGEEKGWGPPPRPRNGRF